MIFSSPSWKDRSPSNWMGRRRVMPLIRAPLNDLRLLRRRRAFLFVSSASFGMAGALIEGASYATSGTPHNDGGSFVSSRQVGDLISMWRGRALGFTTTL